MASSYAERLEKAVVHPASALFGSPCCPPEAEEGAVGQPARQRVEERRKGLRFNPSPEVWQ